MGIDIKENDCITVAIHKTNSERIKKVKRKISNVCGNRNTQFLF